MRLSQKYLDFDAEAKAAMQYLPDTFARLGISQEQYDRLVAELTAWTAALSLYIDPQTHTPAAIENMRMQYDTFYHSILAMRQQLKNDSDITLTADDYTALGIHIDKTTRTRSRVPDVAPISVLLETNHLVNEIVTSQPVQGEERHRAMPDDVQRIGRAIAYAAEGVTPTRDQYHAIDSVGVTSYRIVSLPSEVGMICWLITWYINPRGETGPESEPLSFRVI